MISMAVEINGAEAIAGSILNRFKIIGKVEPNNDAKPVFTIIVSATHNETRDYRLLKTHKPR